MSSLHICMYVFVCVGIYMCVCATFTAFEFQCLRQTLSHSLTLPHFDLNNFITTLVKVYNNFIEIVKKRKKKINNNNNNNNKNMSKQNLAIYELPNSKDEREKKNNVVKGNTCMDGSVRWVEMSEWYCQGSSNLYSQYYA